MAKRSERQKLDGDGWDAVSKRWRHMLIWRTGERAKIKQRLRRALRRAARRELDKGGE